MSAQLFYCPGILHNEFFLSPEESSHCVRVLRKNVGDTIHIIDGQGTFYDALLKHVSAAKCTFDIVNSAHHDQPAYYIHIAIAPTKNTDRTEWFVEKAIEIGVDEITFLRTAHSERTRINLHRIHKKAISAIKQSVRPHLPAIHDIENLDSLLKKDLLEQKFVAHLDEASPAYLGANAIRSGRYLVLIGPEGGFSEVEIELMREHGYESVKLGDHRLRTETAGVMACSILNLINQPRICC
jgi:16S rRNA (uracil1498-N3)-methyltransferase